MEIKQTQNVTVKKEVTIGIKCDVCGKDIHGRYWTFMTGHRDWGYDSCESIEHFDLYSQECIQSKFDEYFKNCENSYTQYMELDQESCD